ncbi:MAG: hypothetical protein IIY06_05050 [Proteobacteria bacterium]|nr:hypothetical protein [Pseudomonadota bacterium]
MIGFFTIVELMGDDDAAGFKVQAKVKSQMNENIIGVLWLPPHLRQGQSNIDVDSTVWGILDEVSGIGCAMMGIGDADFGYFYDANIQVKKKFTISMAQPRSMISWMWQKTSQAQTGTSKQEQSRSKRIRIRSLQLNSRGRLILSQAVQLARFQVTRSRRNRHGETYGASHSRETQVLLARETCHDTSLWRARPRPKILISISIPFLRR